MFSEEFRFARIGLAIFHLRVALPILYLVLYILTLKYTSFTFAGLTSILEAIFDHGLLAFTWPSAYACSMPQLFLVPLLLTWTLNLEFYGRGRPLPSLPNALTSHLRRRSRKYLARDGTLGQKVRGLCQDSAKARFFADAQPFSALLLAVAGLLLLLVTLAAKSKLLMRLWNSRG